MTTTPTGDEVLAVTPKPRLRARGRREQPHLLRLRPDQHGEFARERVE